MPIQIDLGSSSPIKKPQSDDGAIVGIDLGTTNSLVARVLNGKATIISEEGEGPLVPSVVALDANGKVEWVGDSAHKLKAEKAGDVLFSVKRLMGRSLKDLEPELHQIPYKLVDDELKAQVRIQTPAGPLSPVEVSSEILKKLKVRAEKSIGKPVTKAVITVPAYFDDAQRSATKAAGRLAGLNVLRVINEPTAAALAYGWSNEHPGIVVVYDLGGGTFDVSILNIEENTFQVLSTSGDTHLGGDDFDWILVNEFLAKHPSIKATPQERAQLWIEAERVKIELSSQDSSTFQFKDFSWNVSKEEAEKLWLPLIEKTLRCCQQALSDAQIQISEISDVLLVGGSSRIPLVKKSVEQFFARKPNDSVNPDEVVALGASLQAEILAGMGGDRLLMDIVPLSLGIETMGGAITKLIHRNSPLPIEARENFTNHVSQQNAFDLHILQGERELAQDCRSLARFKLRGLDPAPAGYHRIEVLFRIDVNGILNVRAKDLRSGKAQEIEVRPSFGLSENELTQMLEQSFAKAEEDMQKRQLVDLKIEAQTLMKAAEMALKNAGHLVSPQDRQEFQARLTDLKNVYSSPTQDTLQEAMSALEEAGRDLAELQVNQALADAVTGRPSK